MLNADTSGTFVRPLLVGRYSQRRPLARRDAGSVADPGCPIIVQLRTIYLLPLCLLLVFSTVACWPLSNGGGKDKASGATATTAVATTGSSRTKPSGATAATPAPPPTRIIEGGTAQPGTLNPLFLADPVAEALSHLVFNGLTSIDPQTGQATGDLATSWDVSKDRRGYTFHLRSGVSWQDGQPFLARDVVFTYQTMMNLDVRSTRYSEVVNHVTSVTSSDDHTVTIELGQPDSAFLTTIATYGIVPWHVLGDVLPEEQITNAFGSSNAVGTGPFSLVARDLGHEIIFQRNPACFRGPATVQQYIYRMVASGSDLLSGIAGGSIDWAIVDPSLYPQAKKMGGLTVDSLPGYDLSYVVLQLDPTKSQLFQDERVRQALMLALDRPAAIEQFLGGQAEVADGIEPPASWASGAGGPIYRKQLAQAKDLLDAAGWVAGSDGIRVKDGKPFRFTLMTNGTNPTRRAVAGWLAKSWQAVGLDVSVDYEQESTVQQSLTVTHDFDAVLTGYRNSLDPDQTELLASDSRQGGLNAGSYTNATVDQDLSQALASDSRSERRALYQKVSKQVMTDLPILPLWFPSTVVVRDSRLRSVPLTAILIGNRVDIATWKPSGGQ